MTFQVDSQTLRENYIMKRWNMLDDTELEEILACMEDSDRYILEENKDRLINEIKIVLHKRGHIQY